MTKPGLNNGQSKIDVINMSTPPYKVELKSTKIHPKPNLRLIQLKSGKLEFLGVTTHKHDNDVIETKC